MLPLAARAYGCIWDCRPDERKHHQKSVDFESNLVTVILFYDASAKSIPAVIPADV